MQIQEDTDADHCRYTLTSLSHKSLLIAVLAVGAGGGGGV